MKQPTIFISKEGTSGVIMPILNLVLPIVFPKGWTAWNAERNPEPGKPIAHKVLRAIDQTTYMIVIWSKTAQHNAWVNQEVGAALQKGIPILPLIEKGIPLAGMLEGLEGSVYDPTYPIDGLRMFLHTLSTLLKKDGYQSLDLDALDQIFKDISEIKMGRILKTKRRDKKNG